MIGTTMSLLRSACKIFISAQEGNKNINYVTDIYRKEASRTECKQAVALLENTARGEFINGMREGGEEREKSIHGSNVKLAV